MGQKFVKRHNGIPIRNNCTRFHEATSIGRGKKIGEKFFVYFSKKNEKKNKSGGGYSDMFFTQFFEVSLVWDYIKLEHLF